MRIPQKHDGIPYAELVSLHLVISAGNVVHSDVFEREMSMHYFSCFDGATGHVTCRICGSRSVFHCVRGVEHRRTIFHARLGLVRILQMADGTRYAEHVFSIRSETSMHYFFMLW
jgi:hypothetical protein